MPSAELPLFPLNAVLFPHMVLPLQVFEERYVQMIERCLEGDKRFGVVLIREGPEVGGLARPFEVGTVAHIREYRKFEPDRYLMVAMGEQRFRIEELRAEGELLTARVDYFDDEPVDEAALGEVLDEVRTNAHQHLHLVEEAMGRSLGEQALPDDPVAFSFLLAANLPLELDERQALLESRDTASRLRLLSDRLRDEVHTLRHRLDVHQATEHLRSGNGRLKEDHLSPQILGRLTQPEPSEPDPGGPEPGEE